MSAPERIWAWLSGVTKTSTTLVSLTEAPTAVEYIRKDVSDVAIAKARAEGRVSGMGEAANIAAAYRTNPGLPDGNTGAFRKHRHNIAAAILSAIGVTP